MISTFVDGHTGRECPHRCNKDLPNITGGGVQPHVHNAAFGLDS